MILICGLPNAGKTTYSIQFPNVIHFDDIPHKTAKQQFIQCNQLVAEADEDIVVEGVYNTSKRRKELLEACKNKQHKVCIWIDTPIEECIERELKYRQRSINIIYSHNRFFEPPTYDEGWDEIIIVKGQSETVVSNLSHK